MLSDAQIKGVWEGMLGAEVRANYFADLAEKFNNLQRVVTWSILFTSSGALTTMLIQDLPPEWKLLQPALAILTTALSLYAAVRQNYKLAFDAADLHLRWNKLAGAYERLWENVYADNAADVLDGLRENSAELSKAGTSFPYDTKKMLKWEDHVVAHRLPATV